MAPWFHHPGLASFGTAIAYEAKQLPYGSTINCTQSYAATEPSIAPLVRNPGRVSFGTQIIHNDKHYPCASTIKCTQCHPTIKPFVVPCALYAQRVVRIVLNCTQTKKSLYYSLFAVTRWGNFYWFQSILQCRRSSSISFSISASAPRDVVINKFLN